MTRLRSWADRAAFAAYDALTPRRRTTHVGDLEEWADGFTRLGWYR